MAIFGGDIGRWLGGFAYEGVAIIYDGGKVIYNKVEESIEWIAN